MFATLRASLWAYPALEIVHIVGIGLLLGNLVLLELRVFGLGLALPVKELARLSLGLALTGFAVAAGSGLVMFASQPAELLANRAFTLKMLLLLLAACNAAWFHGRGSLARLDAWARLQMLASTLIWLAVVACGRWIAYV
ncbi:MAG: rane protein [Polaromonas sp.]|nr:rane protein [Polaromonas sp.]